MVGRLYIKVPATAYFVKASSASEERTCSLRSMEPRRTDGTLIYRSLRDDTDLSSDYECDTDNDDVDNDESTILPSPGEYEALASGNPFKGEHSVGGSSSFSVEETAQTQKLNKGRLAGFWGRVTTRQTVTEVSKKRETVEEILMRLKREEEEAERILAADEEAALDELRTLGV
ncbi:hypothetical protein JX265_001416 [Neoarthrinium moseri]|uniref:Uncharacterized protein n=1 Tax=Neoarthrinium moseri TaxID=1658444 RepID=A0A9P9WVG0_9PEZI|nr:uncharacterized protein JN550_009838 [Neoarthrinium moseri]KAI1842224.1 hypothetical protein JX266_011632 [Neoarthrinium moseri]KAI1863102.1 hypothetical protein JN550_009838 [Neoarthrinium moseri]KAI1879795.1 hypothetical protein JX265_001416 [Neoarthrinium moseri]